MSIVKTGLDQFVAYPPAAVLGSRLGLLTNPSGIDHRLRSSVNLLTSDSRLHFRALFGPEHGVRGEAQAGEHVDSGRDFATNLPIYSLYGATQSPTSEMLAEIDVLVIDIQDIGVRYATYLSTVAHVLDACAANDKAVLILDRPNPLGGDRVGGNLLDLEFASFVGIHQMPVLHGLTIGEFGLLWARDHQLPPPEVIPMQGWQREMWFDGTGLPWVLPSPNLPTLDSVTVYPATCLIEGTDLSEGRGTTRPFEVIGAPWIEPESLVADLEALAIDGAGFRPIYFTPMFSKHQGVRCGGIQVHVFDREMFDSVAFGPRLLATIKCRYPENFSWLAPADGAFFVDKLAGGSTLREVIDSGSSVDALLSQWSNESAGFLRDRSDILLY
jgi:uncharacterized protein YbbC (DUF1343 family)